MLSEIIDQFGQTCIVLFDPFAELLHLSWTDDRRFLLLNVRFHHHIFPTNLMTNSLTKSPNKHMSHIFVLLVSQKFIANQIGLLQTHLGNFASQFVIKFVAKM
jgi:hypothetical protein